MSFFDAPYGASLHANPPNETQISVLDCDSVAVAVAGVVAAVGVVVAAAAVVVAVGVVVVVVVFLSLLSHGFVLLHDPPVHSSVSPDVYPHYPH